MIQSDYLAGFTAENGQDVCVKQEINKNEIQTEYVNHFLPSPTRADDHNQSNTLVKLEPGVADDNDFADNTASRTLTKSGKPRKSYHRMTYSAIQSTSLQEVFSKKKFLTLSERAHLSDDLGLTQSQIKIWFQNQRARLKRTSKSTANWCDQPTSPTDEPHTVAIYDNPSCQGINIAITKPEDNSVPQLYESLMTPELANTPTKTSLKAVARSLKSVSRRILHIAPNPDTMNVAKTEVSLVVAKTPKKRLQKLFAVKRFLTQSEQANLSNELDLTETQIKIWFQNQRAKLKRTSKHTNRLAINNEQSTICKVENASDAESLDQSSILVEEIDTSSTNSQERPIESDYDFSGYEIANLESDNSDNSATPNSLSPRGQIVSNENIEVVSVGTMETEEEDNSEDTAAVRSPSLTKSGKTRKHNRITYSYVQSIHLQEVFSNKKFLTLSERADLSKELGLTELQIKIWFQNQRAKLKRVWKHADSSYDPYLMYKQYKQTTPPSSSTANEDQERIKGGSISNEPPDSDGDQDTTQQSDEQSDSEGELEIDEEVEIERDTESLMGNQSSDIGHDKDSPNCNGVDFDANLNVTPSHKNHLGSNHFSLQLTVSQKDEPT